MKTQPHEQAFPQPDTYYPDGQVQYGAPGMTKREYFAALAMQGITTDPQRNGDYSAYAEDAVKFADALITALNEEAYRGE